MIRAEQVEQIITAVAERAATRERVFAERSTARLESWIAGYQALESETWGRAIVDVHSDYMAILAASRDELVAAKYTLDNLVRGFGTTRPKRTMPSWRTIANHRGLLDARPACSHCGWASSDKTWATIGGRLERAHIIDRWAGGLDSPANLAPLCPPCHRSQPIFSPGDELLASEWFGLPLGKRLTAPVGCST